MSEPAQQPEQQPGQGRGHDPDPAHEDETFRERFIEAAIEAELATGPAEETVAEARAGVLRRLIRMGFGFTLCAAGLAMMVLPGPGLVVLAAGLVVLARDFVWAERTLATVRRRLPQDETGQIPRRVWVFMGVTCTLGIGLSLWFTFA